MSSAQETRRSARQVVRDDAEANGWTLIDTPFIDVFMRDNRTISMSWQPTDEQRLAHSALRFENAELVTADATVMCIVNCREWLAQEREANATV